jgi:tryptophan synthase alpha chain
MMDRITRKFQELKQKNEKALVGFVTAGDPDRSQSVRIITAMCAAGVDVLELGIPFSDPTSDGPVIQRSSGRALAGGTTLKTVMEMTHEIRQTTDIPLILFSYYNPILAYGPERFHDDAIKAGADGVLIVDLPPEESDEMTSKWTDNKIALIRLVAPTTPRDRMATIAASASGFLYLVSKTGVTGSEGLDPSRIQLHYDQLRSVTDLPICIGFGISTTEQVASVASVAEGIVIGSAFERLIEENATSPNLPDIIATRVAEYKQATCGHS